MQLFGTCKPLFEGEQRYQRVRRALTLMGCSKSKLYSLLRTGRIMAIRLDGLTYIDMQSVAALFEAYPEYMPSKIIEARTLSAEQLGLPKPDEPIDLPAPPDPDAPLPDFCLSTADLLRLSQSSNTMKPSDR